MTRPIYQDWVSQIERLCCQSAFADLVDQKTLVGIKFFLEKGVGGHLFLFSRNESLTFC